MDLESKYAEIKNLLSIPNEEFQLRNDIERNFDSDLMKLEILGKINQFISNFSLFKEIEPFMYSVYNCIVKTVDLKAESISDFYELLIKNTLMMFIQEYIDYAQLSQKRQIMKLLSDSLDKLQIQPLIINLGLLLKPMYQDQEYVSKLRELKETEVSYTPNKGIELNVKESIDSWLKTQNFSLDNQNLLRNSLELKFESIAEQHNLAEESKTYQKLKVEVMEMLSLKLTMISLSETMIEETFEPIPIK
jgi:hypothetical protein